MNSYDVDALMAYYKKHQISRRTAVIGGAVVVVAGSSAAYLALSGGGGQPEQTIPSTPSTPSTPTAPSTPSTPSAPSTPSTPAPTPAPSPPTQETRRIIATMPEDMPNLFPLSYPPGGAGPHRTVSNFQEVLVYLNRDHKSYGGQVLPVNLLATSVEPAPGSASGDWTRIRVKIRENVRFHSGDKLDSRALAGPFGFQDVYADSNWRFYYPTRSLSVEVIDDHTVDMVYPRTNLSNLVGLTHTGRPFIWNPNWVEAKGLGGRGANFGGEDQDGTGPFKVKEWIPGIRLTMERNRDYWADNLPDAEKQEVWGASAGNVDEVIYVFIKEPAAQLTALKAGDIDVIINTELTQVAGLERDPNINTFDSGAYSVFVIYVNSLYPPLSDVRVRQAIMHSIDPRGLRALFDDRVPVAKSMYLPWALGYDENIKLWRPQDIGKAKQLLSESGYKDGFDLSFATDARGFNQLMAGGAVPMIQKVGINATIRSLDSPTWNTLTSDRTQTELHMWPFTIGQRKESFDFIDFFFRAGFRRLRSQMEIPFLYGTFDPTKPSAGRPDFGLIGKISREGRESERAKLYTEVAQYVSDEALLLEPLWFSAVASYSKKVTNWNDLKGPFWRGNGNWNAYRTKVV